MFQALRRDDRGRLCRLLVAHPLMQDLLLPPGHPDHRLNHIRQRFLLAGRPIDAALNVLAPGLAASFAPLFGVMLFLMTQGPLAVRRHYPWIDASTCIAVTGFYVTLFLAGLSTYRLCRYRGSGRFTRDLSEVERCVACGYDLHGLEAEFDDCVTCPECGAGWRCGESDCRPALAAAVC